MPVGFNSAARNLFLLGSSGADLVTNFFKRIDQSAGTDGVYLPDEIRYNVPDQKFLFAGSAEDSNSKGFGWFEKRTQGGSADWNVKVQSTEVTNENVTIRALELDSNDNLIVCGKAGAIPWIAKYTNGGDILWQVSSITPGIEYRGIAIDSNDNLYACGETTTPLAGAGAFVEKIDGTGSYNWSRYSTNTAGNIELIKCAANDRGEVVAVGKIEDTLKDKGYIAKVNTATGELLWDKTIEDHRFGASSSYLQTECTDVYIDNNDQIYIVGSVIDNVGGTSKGFIAKYTAEGNLIWQKETPADENIQFTNVKSDTETEQTIVFGTYVDSSNNNLLMLSKYSKDGSLTWRRILYTSIDLYLSTPNLDADPSFYYLLFIDQEINQVNGTPDSYVFGKVSSSGNGLGNFEYSDGIGTVFYETSNITDNIGRLYDGSVRIDTSDLITYPFGANKILFDDLATQVANKKVQVYEVGTYTQGSYFPVSTYYPKISKDAIVYDNNLLLNYDFSNPSSYNYNHNLFSGSDFSTNNSPTNTTLTTNSALAPDGSFTAASIDGNPGTSLKYFYKGYSTTTTGTYTTSVYAKYKSEQFIVLRINDNGGVNGALQRFDILNGTKDGTVGVGGTATNGSSTITPVGNGWYRLSVTVTFNSALVQIQGSQVWLTAYSSTSSTGGVYIWGSQLVFGSNILPYTKTTSINILPSASTSNLSSTSYTGTINGATFNSAGYFNFDGINDDISVVSSFTLSDNNPITIESWVNADTTTNEFQVISTAKATTTHWQLSFTGNSTYNILWAFAGTSNSVGTTTLPSTGAWHHIVATYDGGDKTQLASWKVYVDGSSSTIQLTGSTGAATNETTIGHRTGGPQGNRFDGKIGEVRIYNRALDATEVSKNFNATRAKYGV